MENNRQGVLAQVVKSGRIAVYDLIKPFKAIQKSETSGKAGALKS